MTDKELLELAAKAIGLINTRYHLYTGKDYDSPTGILHDISSSMSTVSWNPLTDDGDALRLAVKLRMEVYVTRYEIEIHAHIITVFQPTDDDVLAATRRAIVRAAAEIGKAIP